MPTQPPSMTRRVGLSGADPAIRALRTPVTRSPASVKPTMLHALAPRVGANAPKKGITPPNVKLAAEAIAA